MATIIPSLDRIQSMTVKPTMGELHLLKELSSLLSDEYEVFFNPYMNGDRPDIVIFHERFGVLIIEVKDWDLDLYELDDHKNWKLKYPRNDAESRAVIKSPISQVLRYKDNLFELHIEKLLELKIKDIRSFNFVSCAVYFHNGTRYQIEKLLVSPYTDDKKYMNFLKRRIRLLSRDELSKDIHTMMHDFWMDRPSTFGLFTKEIADSIKRFLQPTEHMKEDGIPIPYVEEQRNVINSTQSPQRIKGVFGSGKTTVLAARAAKAASMGLDNILILCYNITLKNYIHDALSKVQEHFQWSAFTINNYHEFINSQLNNLGVVVIPPSEVDLNKIIEDYGLNFKFFSDKEARDEAISIYFEMNYYGNTSLFEKHISNTTKYDAIYIDEIQDYHHAWMVILKKYFLKEKGQYVLFGDVKQNIYGNITENRDVKTNVPRRPVELKKCHRSQFKVRELALNFQKSIFKDRYDIDEQESLLPFNFGETLKGYINYIYFPNINQIPTLYNVIHGNIENKGQEINPNDITILGYRLDTLRRFEAYYRYKSHEKTATMFETYEIMFLMHLNYLRNNKPAWYRKLQEKAKNVKNFENKLALVLTIYYLRRSFKNDFAIDLEKRCNDINCSIEEFDQIIHSDQEKFNAFEKIVFSGDYDIIRKNKKIHFWMNTGTIKVSTIQSFKGWESTFVFLILEAINNNQATSFEELIYTAITRSRANLVIINYGNELYHNTLKQLIKES